MPQKSHYARYGASFVVAVFLAIAACNMASRVVASTDHVFDYYSVDYREARHKFLVAARAAGGSIESYRNPALGPRNQPLHLDVATFGSMDAGNLLVLGSGTHGVEGFVGSAIQTGLLREGIHSQLGPGTGLVVIHAINPYGFAYQRRFNEDNVDLNRNFLDHSRQHPENPGYDQIADAITPESLSLWSNAKASLRLLFYRLRRGSVSFRRAISSGQYTHPLGLFYGGQSDTWSNKTIKKVAGRYLSGAKRVVVIDFHSGLGPFAEAEVILNVPKNSPVYLRSAMWWGERVRTTMSGESVSIHPHGSLKLAFSQMLLEAEVTAVSLEYGTLPPLEVFWALRAENWLHHYGSSDYPARGQIKEDLLRAFYPDDPEWRRRAWQQGREVVLQAIDGLQTDSGTQQ